jgi:cytochrome b subunit of formate dehydrogenase
MPPTKAFHHQGHPRVAPPSVFWGGAVLLVLTLTQIALAADAENCLMCHRFRGLSRVDKNGDYRLFFVDENLFSRGPHARVSCTGCHADIKTIPHNDALPVDCLQSCHIQEPTREIVFTHAKVHDTLEGSVHARVAPDGTEREHPEDFPRCKDCHDNPLFRPVSFHKTIRSGVSDRAISRCIQCHSDESFTRYYYNHVTSRMHKARDPREVVEMCSSCHADAEFAARHNLPNVVSSYMETYHGKAVLFGSKRAPDCLDCHASYDSVHEMLANNNPLSSVHSNQRAATCQTVDCHPEATPALASFDVHATRNPKTHPLEFTVALLFVIMTLAILLPILTVNVLGLIRELLPSHQAEAEIEALTEQARQHATRNNGIQRFTGAQRAQHAFLVTVFVILCLTGLPMKFPEAGLSQTLYPLVGGIQGAPIVHRVAGVAMLIGFALHVLVILVKFTRDLQQEGQLTLRTWIERFLKLPMIPNWQDLLNIIALTKYVLFLSPKRPHYDRFSWKEKLEYLGLFWGITLLGVTGILLWSESLSSRFFPGWLLNVCYLAHTYESLLAAAHITLVHIPGVLGRPGVNPLSAMIWDGKISPRMQAEEHGAEISTWRPAQEVVS